MTRLIAVLIVALIAGTLNTSSSFAQSDCSLIQFPAGKDDVVLGGIAPPESGVCYDLKAEVGETFSLKVASGNNIVFSIIDVRDGDDHLVFTAQKTSYRMIVAQLMRSTSSENFRISIGRSKRKGEAAIHANGEKIATDKRPPVAAEPLKPFRDCNKCPEMVALPAGRFEMGASAKETRTVKYTSTALPQHMVTIGYPFAIGRFEVTVEEFDAYVKDTGAKVGGICAIRLMETGKLARRYTGTPHPKNNARENGPFVVYVTDASYTQPGLPVTARQPAVCVSRNEIKGYLGWLGKKTGYAYRMLTEAEWEYAYRAGTQTISFWGDDFRKTCQYANFGDRNSGYQAGMMAPCGEVMRPEWTAEVGRYKPNPWGLYDMAGNAQEAVEDCFHKSYNGAPTDGSPWTEQGCLSFVARGGDYELPHLSMRASSRLFFGYASDDRGDVQGKDSAFNGRSNVVGFRVARSLSDAAWDHARQLGKSEHAEEGKNVVKAVLPTSSSRNCGGSYIFVQQDTMTEDPVLGAKADRQSLVQKGDAASWYDVACDAAGRPALLTHYLVGSKHDIIELEYSDATGHVARRISRKLDGSTNFVSHFTRDTQGRPVRVENIGPDGHVQKIGIFSYQNDQQILDVTNADSGAVLGHAIKWYNGDGTPRRATWSYPNYRYDYFYEANTGNVITQDKYNSEEMFERTTYEFDPYGNRLKRTFRCTIKICDTVTAVGYFDHNQMVREDVQSKDGTRFHWDNHFNDQGNLENSLLYVNDNFAVKFVVEREGTAVLRTTAYSLRNEKLFVYENAETVYIKRDGSPVNGGKFKRFTRRAAW